MLEELWTEVYTIGQEAVTKAIHKKARRLSEEALQIVEERKEMKNKGKEKDMSNWMQSSREQQREIRKLS